MLRPNSILYSLLSKIKNGFWKPHLMSVELILNQYFIIKTEGNLVQIGSNDGISNDPLYKHLVQNLWNAILVEPVPHTFEKLKINYNKYKNRIKFENSIISSSDGFEYFYSLNKKSLHKYPIHANQLSSLTDDVILLLKPEYPNVEKDIIKSILPSITFDSLIKKYSFNKVDLIHIDVEGNDDKIIASINMEKYQPDIVIFEHIHLTKKSYKTLLNKFKQLKYKVYYFNIDTIAINRKLQKKFPKIGEMKLF